MRPNSLTSLLPGDDIIPIIIAAAAAAVVIFIIIFICCAICMKNKKTEEKLKPLTVKIELDKLRMGLTGSHGNLYVYYKDAPWTLDQIK